MNLPDWVPATGEEVVWEGRPRREVLLLGAAVGLVAASVVLVAGHFAWGPTGSTAFLAARVALAAVGFAVPTLAAYLWRRYTHYVLTDAALYHRTGVVRVTVTELGLDKIQNTAYAQGALGAFFDHGTITVDTAGSDGAELRMRQLNDPGDVHRILAAAAQRAGGRDDVPGTADQWRTALDELRRIRPLLADD